MLDASTDSGTLGDRITSFTRPQIDGTAESGSTVTIYSGGSAVGTGLAVGGVYQITITTALTPDGVYSITAQATDAAGNTGVLSGILSVTIDTTPPAVPSTPVLDASTDSGLVGDNLTNFTRPRFDGTAEASSTVTIYSGGAAVGSGVATGGVYQITITTALTPDGVFNITAQAANPAGNASPMSGALALTIDTTPPTAPLTPVLDPSTDSGVVGDNITNFAKPQFDGKAGPGSTVTIYSDGAAVGTGIAAGGVYAITPTTALADGPHGITAKTTDAAGNTASSAALTVTIDTVAPIWSGPMRFGPPILVSTDSSGNQGNADSSGAAMSADGRYLAFSSNASNLVPGDTNGCSDAFVKDLQTGITTRVSADSAGNQGNGASFATAITPDGRYAVIVSNATNFVAGDTNGSHGNYDVFVKDLQTAAIVRVNTDSSGNQANGSSLAAVISADGRYVAFLSNATQPRRRRHQRLPGCIREGPASGNHDANQHGLHRRSK